MLFTTLALALPVLAFQAAEEKDLAAARELFQKNIQAIQERDREAYLSCYRKSERLVRVGPDGFQKGYTDLADGTPPTGSDEWPDSLVARDLAVTWVREGIVYGTYRYRAVFDGEASEGISGRLFMREDDGWKIAVTSAFGTDASPAAAPMALVGATVHDGNGGAPLEDAVIIMRNGRIEAVGARTEIDLPDGLEVVDLTGRYVVPGFVDTHVHYSQTGWADGRPDASDQRKDFPYVEAMATNRMHPERFHRAFLRSGVTAVFDVGGYPWTLELGARTENATDAPHVAVTGPLIAALQPAQLRLPDQDQLLLMETEEGVRAMVRSHVAQGSDAIKVWFVMVEPQRFDEIAALVLAVGDEAKKHGIPLVVHSTTLATAKVAVEAGAHLLVHSVDDQLLDEEFLEAAAAAGVHYCPTLTVRDGYGLLYMGELSDEVRGQLEHVHPSVRERVLRTESLPNRIPKTAREGWEDGNQRRWETMAANLMAAHAAGITVVLGTDAGNPLTLHGPSVFPEMESMQRAGLSPLETLTASTRNAARAMMRGDDLGLIAEGYIADLVVLERDPAEDAANLRSITHVVRAGFLHDRDGLVP